MECGKKVREAIAALKKFEAKKEGALLEDDHKVYISLSFHVIPDVQETTIRTQLPHRLHKKGAEVCLFVKDVNKFVRDFDPTVNHYEELLKERGVTCITKIVPLKSLKTEYKPYEAKRNLSNMYDTYLTDKAIHRLLPKFLGKNFLGRKRFPEGVNLKAKDLKQEIDRALCRTRTDINGRGPSCSTMIGHINMSTEDILANAQAVVNKFAETIPGGWKNVKVLHLKTLESPALTIYAALGSPNDIELPKRKIAEKWEDPEDVTTIEGALVRVKKSNFKLVNEDGSEKPTHDGKRKKKKLKKHESKKVNKDAKEKKQKIGKGQAVALSKNIKDKKKDKKITEDGPPSTHDGVPKKKQKVEETQSIPTQNGGKKRKLENTEASVVQKKKKVSKELESKLQAVKNANIGKGFDRGEAQVKAKTKGDKIKAKGDLRKKTKSMQKQTKSNKVVATKGKHLKNNLKHTKKGGKKQK